MPPNKKKTKKKQKASTSTSSASGGANRGIRHIAAGLKVVGGEPNYFPEPARLRPEPEMNVGAAHQRAGVEDGVRAAERGGGDGDDNVSPTLRRFSTAYRLMDSIEHRLEEAAAAGGSSEMESNIAHLSSDPAHMALCADLLRALALTDHRLGVPAAVVRHLRVPECALHVTFLKNLPAGSSDDVQLHNVGVPEFVCLLAAAFALFLGTGPHGRGIALRLVHELHAHAKWNYDWLDFDDPGQEVRGSDGRAMTEEEVRFSLASVGVKVTRTVYRNGLEPMPGLGPPPAFLNEAEPNRENLLASIEAFAREQIEYGSGRGLGEFNLGWVASQCAAVRHSNALEAAADCLEWMTKAYEAADEYQDDFIRSAARIEAALCLVIGGGGIVGTAGGDVVERDFRSRAAKIADKTIKRTPTADGGHKEIRSFDKIIIRAYTAAGQKALRDAEIQRAADFVPDTFVERGAVLLIEPWEVRRLWNQAMDPFDALAKWNHSHFVYGESQGWQPVVDCLRYTKNNPYNKYEACGHPGFPLRADGGMPEFSSGPGNGGTHTKKKLATCLWCGKNGYDFKRCTKVSMGYVHL
jgi:hypothetical protein